MKTMFTALCLLVCLHSFSQTIYYVNDNASGANNGNSWTNAFTKLQNALAAAVSGDQIWVAAGTYYPDEGAGLTNNNRSHSFFLKNGVAIYGGFAGTETNLSERNWNTHVTTLSGDITQNVNGNNINNSFHVVQSASVDNTAVLDGFTITGGNANGLTLPDNLGGGMYNNASSPTLTNCSFSGNWAGYFSGSGAENGGGGGMYNNASSPTLTNCNFSENEAERGGGMFNDNASSPILTNCNFSANMVDTDGLGAGMFNRNSSPTLINCSFLGNRAIDAVGGGMFNSGSSPILTNCIFSRNDALGWGGGMFNSNSSPTLTNCIFSGNWADYEGGGMYNISSSPILTNCSFSGNTAYYNGGGMFNSGSSPTLTNCILWGNINGQIIGNAVVTYSIVQGGFTGTGNLDQDPLFVDAANGDLHLQAGSPAIDAGLTSANTTTVDLDGKPRIVNGTIDMGAYEFQGTPPVVITSVTANPSTLWPPNHKMKEVKVTTVTTGGSGNTQCSITKVTSNEPQNGGGKNNVSPDWQIIGADKVLLRAERNGNGNGRIYTITVTCTDAVGSSTSKTVQVKVPHDQGKAEITQSERNEILDDISGALQITASPNPSNYTFNVIIIGGDAQESILLRVINTQGKVVEQRQNLRSGQALQIGEDYAAGMYIIEIQQGSERKTIKVVKQ
jgi:hypothetical protein